jgi:hypothetical protein
MNFDLGSSMFFYNLKLSSLCVILIYTSLLSLCIRRAVDLYTVEQLKAQLCSKHKK